MLLPVKENHKQMYDDIQQLFEPLSETDATEVETRRFENLHTQEGAHLHTYTHVETSHGLTTTRTLTASTLLTITSNGPESLRFINTNLSEKTQKQPRFLADAVWHHESLTRSRIRRRLSNSDANIGLIVSIGSEITVLRTLHRREPGVYHKSSRHYATSAMSVLRFEDTQKSLNQYDFSLQNLYSQLNSSNEKLEN